MSLSHLLEMPYISRISIVSHGIVLFVCGGDLIDRKHNRDSLIVVSEYAFYRALPIDPGTSPDRSHLLGAVRLTPPLAHHLSHRFVEHEVALHELSYILRLIHHRRIACVVIY